MLSKLNRALLKAQVIRDTRGQDLVEYALLAGFIAVAAGALLPTIATSISTIFSKLEDALKSAGG